MTVWEDKLMKTEWTPTAVEMQWYAMWQRFYGTHTKRLIALLFGVLSYFFLRAELPYGVYPLGPALLAGCSLSQAPLALVGALVALFTEQGDRIPLLAAILVTLLIRIWVGGSRRMPLLAEAAFWRVLAGASGATLFSLYRLFSGGFRRYDMLGLAVGVGVAAVLAPLFAAVTAPKREGQAVGACALVAAVCYALRAVQLLTFLPSVALATAASGLFAVLGGMLPACVAGLVCGLAGGSFAIPLALGALAGGYLAGQHKTAGLLVLPSFAALYLVLTEGAFSAIGFLGSGVPGVLAVLFVLKTKALSRLLEGRTETDALPERQQGTMAADKLFTCFRKLGETLGKLSGRFVAPAPTQVVALCEGECRSRGRGCMSEESCWSGSTPIRQILVETVGEMDVNMQAAVAKFHRRVPAGCPQQDAHVQCLRATLAGARERAMAEDRIAVCAQMYDRMARIYKDTLERTAAEEQVDRALTKKVQEVLSGLQIHAREITVRGARLPRILLRDVMGLAESKEGRLTQLYALAQGIGIPLSPFEITDENGVITATTSRAPLFCGKLTVRAEDKSTDSVSGDLIGEFTTADHYYIALLCDGMGSGREAALRARLCKVFAGQMLGAGCSCADTLAAISDVLRFLPGECFSTFDLIMVDLLDGQGRFVKSGATASYVLRGERLYRVASRSLPLGITQEITAEETVFAFKHGDVVLLQSDGIVAGAEDEWLTDLLSEDRGEEIPTLLERILLTAKRSGAHPDDRTVGAVEISERSA